jgi:hypothetical protein
MAVGADRPAVGRRFRPWLPASQRTLWVPVTVLVDWTAGAWATLGSLLASGAALGSVLEEDIALRVASLEVELGSIGERQRSTEISTNTIKPPSRASSIRGGEELEERPDIMINRDLVVFSSIIARKKAIVGVDVRKVCDRRRPQTIG